MAAKRLTGSRVIWLLILVVLAAGIWLVRGYFRQQPAIRHVVLISLDTTRADHIGCYGFPRPITPNIDTLAAEGWLFENTLTPIPFTLPAHTSMLTGTIPPRHGKHTNQSLPFDSSITTLAQMLKELGYQTGAFVGAQVLNQRFGLNRGFDVYNDQFNGHERSAAEVNREAFRWLDLQQDEPVFLFLHYYDPHDAYEPPEPFATQFRDNPYAGEIAWVDHCVGDVVEELKRHDMFDSTLLIVVADHGEMLGEHGEETHTYFIYQSAIKVPMVFRLPGGNPPQRVSELASIVDIVPTVCEMLDLPAPQTIQGKSLAGWFRNQPPLPEDRYLYAESMQPTFYGANPLLGMVGLEWKYIHTTRPELYHLTEDAGELSNLYDEQPRRAAILKENLEQVAELAAHQAKPSEQVQLAPDLINHLRSLGYVGESTSPEAAEFDEKRDDPKDLIEYHNAFSKASHLVADNRLQEALSTISTALEQRPGFVFCDLATRIYLKLEDYDQAIHYGEMAVELRPGYAAAHEQLAFAYSFARQDEKAAEQYELTLKHMPADSPDFTATRSRLHYQLGMTRLRQNRRDLAMVQFEEGLRLNADQPLLLDALASVLLDNVPLSPADSTRALESARRACSLTQLRNPGFMSTMARAMAAQGQFAEAMRVAEQALAMAVAAGDNQLADGLRRSLQMLQKNQVPGRE